MEGDAEIIDRSMPADVYALGMVSRVLVKSDRFTEKTIVHRRLSW
jgi:metal-sulfur cluster biosynthetic enzyme